MKTNLSGWLQVSRATALFCAGFIASFAHASTVATPAFSPVAGTYTSAQSVTITSTTSGASIRYTTDGSTPSTTTGTIYSGPVSISTTTTLKAIAYETGFTNSTIKSGTYTIKVLAPVFSPAVGTYTSPQTVTITSATNGASIRYTTDGSTPSATAGTIYSSPVVIGVTTTLKAIAYETGLTSSAVTSGAYTIKAATPIFSPAAGTYTSGQSVTITSTTGGASLAYTTDGTTPTESGGTVTNGTLYSGPVSISQTTTLKAIAYESGLTDSAVASGTYTINLPPAATPTFSPAAGTYTSVQSVTISSTTSGATIRYTTDGSAPSATAGTIYSSPVSISITTTLKAIAYETGFKNSAVKSGTYTINLPTAAAPVFGPPAGNYNSAQTISITSATSGASIRYTTDGSIPSATAGTLYSGPVSIGTTTTLEAVAYKTNFNNSTVTSGTYTITPPPAITSSLTSTGQVDTAFSYQITATNSPTSYNAAGLPPGLSVDTSTGLITGTPTTAGPSSITISAGNSGGGGSATLVLTINPEPVTFTVSPVSFTYNGSAQGPTITPSVSGATYSTSGTASATSAGSYSVTATATGNYTGTSGPIAWTITKATPVVIWSTPAPIVYGTALDATQLSATADVPGAFTYTPDAGTVLNVGTQTLSVAFTPTDAIDYNNASASVTLQVNAEPVTFTVSPVSFTYNGSTQGPTITPSVSGATYSTSGTASATSAGSYSVTATATGNYAGTSGPIGWTTTKATPVVTWSTPAPIVYGTALDATQLSATADVPGAFAYTPAAGTVLNVGTQTLSVAFTPTDAIDYNNASASVTLMVNPPPPSTPVFSPAGGSFTSGQSVSITSLGADSIYYTTDGTAPTTASTLYSGAVTISNNTVLQAIGVNSGGNSPVGTASFTILPPAPAFSPAPGTYTNVTTFSVTITDAASSTIYYTTDGSTPTTASTPYTASVSLPIGTTTLSAIAVTVNGSSAVTAGIYILTPPPPFAPTFSPSGGTFTSIQSVTITSAGATSIYYTTDGTAPTTSSTLYTGAVSISTSTVLKAIGVNSSGSSSVATAGFTIVLQVAAPVFSPAAGSYSSAQTVTISTTTSGASIRYTIDGSTPTKANGKLYSVPVTISGTTLLKAIAYKSGVVDSAVTSGIYTIGSPAALLNVMYDFTGANHGGYWPYAGLVAGSDGNFYGTTASGGSNTLGTVFKMTPTGVLTTLVSFNGANGSGPLGCLVQGNDGNFYGTTNGGGSANFGTVFKMTPAGALTTLASFSGANGGYPEDGLVQGSDHNFYGTTSYGGDNNLGTVFQITPAGTLTSLVSFNGANGSTPFAGLVQGSDGNFYGTTEIGGTGPGIGYGTVFKMTPTGALTTLVLFNGANGGDPYTGSLVQGSDGNIYGTTQTGGSGGGGTVFKMTPAGALTNLVSFTVADGGPMGGVVQGTDGNFYGTTDGGGFGKVFRMTPTGILTILATFDGVTGQQPEANLVQGSDGNFYCTTQIGGLSSSGVIFQLIMPPTTAAPAFSPAAGAYPSAQMVTISTATGGATIRYTTNGSLPTESNGTLYSGPISIGANTTLAAIAYKSGLADSSVTSGTYTIGGTMPAPMFSLPGGNYASAQTVTITDDFGFASIRYTTDGSTPSETNGTLYSGPVNISNTTTLAAIAYAPGFIDSTVTSNTYTIGALPPAAAPTFNPPGGSYQSALYVTISTATSGASIRYTTDGSTPTETNGLAYNGPVWITDNVTLKAIAYGSQYTTSPVASASYTVVPLPAPTFDPPSGSYQSALYVTISDSITFPSTPQIRYTTDGSTPTETNGLAYNGPVFINGNVTLKAIAYGSQYTTSPVASASYTVVPLPAPTFNPPSGSYQSALYVTISDSITFPSTPQIRYTTDGSTPTETNGLAYNGPVWITGNVTLKAIAYGSQYTTSPVASASYTVVPLPAPTFNPPSGSYQSALYVTISDSITFPSTPQIRYTTDGSTPTETNGLAYNGPVFINGNVTLKAIAYGMAFTDSAVISATYTFPPTAAAPVFSPAAGTYSSAQAVSITTITSGATIRYTTDGSMPTETNGAIYSGPVTINATTTLNAIAYAGGLSDSPVTSGLYTINLPPAAAPTFSPAAGTYSSVQTVTISSTTNSASFRYTTDGSTPTDTNGTLYSGPISISQTTMLKSIAYATGAASDSPVTSGLYTITISPATIVNVLYDFASSNNGGIYPYAPLVQGSDGNFYSTTYQGGSTNFGTVFELTPTGIFTALASFNGAIGSGAFTGVVQGSDGNFYGTTTGGGSGGHGTVFKMTQAGVLTALVSFNGANGANANGLVQGSDGNLYGTTSYGGTSNYGTVFKMTPAGALTTLFSFSGTNGQYPQAALIQGSDGNFYGTTQYGGSSNSGTVFKITPTGTLTSLASFTSSINGGSPGGLVQGSDGNLYGTTTGSGNGTVFKMTPAGALTTLVTFTGANGKFPYGSLVQGSDGNLYGTTDGGGSGNNGTIFKINPSGALTTLFSFDGANGSSPMASLKQAGDGSYYGTTLYGGAAGSGVIFQLIPAP